MARPSAATTTEAATKRATERATEPTSEPTAASAASPLGNAALRGRALRWLAQREQSEMELRRKLLHWVRTRLAASHDADANADDIDIAHRIDETLAWLRSHGHLSDARFAESRVHARAARYGNQRIRQELAMHGVELGDEVALELRCSEADRAARVWQRQFGHPPADAAERARQSQFLARRGFSSEAIRTVLRGTVPGDHTDPDTTEL